MREFSKIVYAPKCANCDELRDTSNHWWVIYGSDGAFAIRPMPGEYKLGDLQDDVWYVCGQRCAGALFNEYMSNKLFGPSAAAHADNTDQPKLRPHHRPKRLIESLVAETDANV